MPVAITPYKPSAALTKWLTSQWGAPVRVWQGVEFAPRNLEGFVARRTSDIGGIITFVAHPDRLHIVSLDASQRRDGIGATLLAHVVDAAHERGAARITVTTTNDDIESLAFWQYHGFRLVALRPDAVEPRDSSATVSGIEPRDEIDLEFVLRVADPDDQPSR